MFDPNGPPLTFRQFLVAPFKDLSVDQAGGFLKGNIFFLIWILIVPLLMFGVKQGWELLYGLFDDTGAYPGFRAASMLFIYYLLAMAIWLLPIPFFPEIAKQNDHFAATKEFDKLRQVTKDNPYRGLLVSALPMIFFSIVMIWVQTKRGFTWWQWVATLVTVAAGAYAMWWVMERSKWKIGKIQFLMGMNWALVFLLVWIGKEARAVFWNYYFVGLCMIIQIALLGGLIKHLEARMTQPGMNRTHRRYYRFVFWTVVTGTLLLSFVNNLNLLSPTFVLLVIITCFVLLNDLLIAFYVLTSNRRLKIWVTVLLGLVGLFIFFYPSRIHNINYVKSDLKAQDTRVDFHAYFEDWYKTNIAPGIDTTETGEIPVYLVAAQGGGSRAGLWTSEILNRLEIESDYKFHRHLFAVTSASGGSVGTGSTLSLWRYLEENPGIDTADRRQLCQNFAPEMFRRNYLSSQFMQLFVNEVGKRFLSLVKKDVFDRNFEHQRHEALSFANAVRYGYELNTQRNPDGPFDRLHQIFLNGDGDSLGIGKKRPRIANYPMRPYLSYWYTGPKQPDTRLPLYFPITLNIQTGKSGYASAIAWDSTLFVDAIDLLCEAEKKKEGHSLALVTATNLSQIFPIMNSYTYIPGTGNFMDGGLFENMGLTLMSRIQERLKNEIANSPNIPESVKKRLKIKILFLINDDIKTPEGASFDRLNQMTATVKAVASSSIQGRNTWWVDYFYRSLPPGECPDEYVLQGPTTPERDKVPLGRWLSNRSVEMVCHKVDSLPFGEILGPLKK